MSNIRYKHTPRSTLCVPNSIPEEATDDTLSTTSDISTYIFYLTPKRIIKPNPTEIMTELEVVDVTNTNWVCCFGYI